MGTAGATQYFLASAMMETETLTRRLHARRRQDGDAFNAGLAKQNWGMIRRCHPAWKSQTATQYMTSTAMNSSLALDIQVYDECRSMFGNQWWAGHSNGYNNLNTNTQDIQEFKAGMDWTNTQLTGHLTDDVRFWVTIRPINLSSNHLSPRTVFLSNHPPFRRGLSVPKRGRHSLMAARRKLVENRKTLMRASRTIGPRPPRH